jgi:uncharacterized membrane protein
MKTKPNFSERIDALKRAFVEFLTLPTLIIAAFLALAFASYAFDKAGIKWLEPIRNLLKSHVFANSKATSDLLSAIAAGIISVTSLTITLLLIVVQQSAASMTSQVFDQFLRRKTNQVYFGFFVGLALYSLITLATVNDPFNPVWGGTFAFVLTVIALYLLVLLMYTTINQMRPVEIIEAIHTHILSSRESQLGMIRQTRQVSGFKGKFIKQIISEKHGYVTKINIEKIGTCLKKINDETEVVLLVSIGSYIAFGDTLAQLKTNNEAEAERLCYLVLHSIHLDVQRDIDADAAYGIEQLETIGWTSISTSKSNPSPGLLVIRSLRDILARWSAEKPEENSNKLPVVYTDSTIEKLMNAFETLAVVSSESMQHQNFIEVVNTLTVMLDRLPEEWQLRTEDIVLRILSALGDHVLTAELEKALSALADKLHLNGKLETALAVQKAKLQLSISVGKLNSRSTRVPVSS